MNGRVGRLMPQLMLTTLALACGRAAPPPAAVPAITADEVATLEQQVAPDLGGAATSATENLLQDFELGNGTSDDRFCFDYGKARAAVSADRAHGGARALKVEGDKFGINLAGGEVNVAGYGRIFVWIYDLVGDNTVEFELKDADGGSAKAWSTERSRKNQWARVSLRFDQLTGQVNLARLKTVEFYEWNPGVYFFDDLGVEQAGAAPPEVNAVVEAPRDVDLTPPPPLGPRDVVLQDFEAGNGTEASVGAFFWDYGKARASLAGDRAAGGARSLKTAGDKVGVNFRASPVDLTEARALFLYVYDANGDNTVELELHDAAGKSFKVWSAEHSSRGRWARINLDLAPFRSQLDLAQVKKMELFEWNQGVYYFDNIGYTRR